MTPLAARLAKLESKYPTPEENRPWISAGGDDRDRDALYRLLEAEGYDTGPDSRDRFIVRWIVTPAAQADTELVQPYIEPRIRFQPGGNLGRN